MKIIFANNYFYLRGGTERNFFEESKLLELHGHKITPFTRHHEKNYNSEYAKYFPTNFEYENVSLFKKFPASFKLIYSYECRSKFSELLTLFSPDIIHVHNIYGRLTTSVIDEARKREIPVVMTLNDYKLICPSYLMLSNSEVCEKCKGRKFYYCALKRCHKESFIPSLVYTVESYFNSLFRKYDWVKYFICPSKFLLEKHAEAGISDEKLVHIPHFVNAENFEPDYAVGNYVLFVGRLSREKGILTLLKAVKGLDVPLRIVGEGPMKAEYETYVQENKINDVSFEGYKSGENLRDFYKNAAFIVVSSEWYEVAGKVILEAFACGKPVIAAEIGGIPELVTNHETSLLFKPGEYQELREKIDYLLSNPSIITQMGKNARKKIEEEYNPEIHYQKLMDVYERALT